MGHRNYMLDQARWIAAFMVVIGHIRSLLLNDYSLSNSNLIKKLFYFITGFGHQAVIIFFVLSGYLISQTVIDQFKCNSFDIGKYLISRVTRIYIVLIPALCLTYFLDKIGGNIDVNGVYTNYSNIISLAENPSSRLGINYLISSLLMLQNIWLPVFGSNGPLWSLSLEFLYYLIIPVAVYFFYSKRYISKILSFLLIIAFFALLPTFVLKYFFVWICGVIPYFITINKKFFNYLILICCMLSFFMSRIYNFDQFDFINSIVFALFICTIDNTKTISLKSNWNKRLAAFSYSLYLVHFPLTLLSIVVIDKFLTPAIRVPLNVYSFCIYLGVLIIVYLVSYLFARLTEHHTEFVKNKLIRY